MNFPDKKYSIIYADRGCNGACERHYTTMPMHELLSLPVPFICAPDCVLFLWATYPMLPEALKVIAAWGFIYKSIAFQWVKLNKVNQQPFFGLGRWTRGNTEPCLLAVRGKPKRISAGVAQLIFAHLARHSEKPGVTRDRIVELMGDLPRIELFARQQVTGWDAWGDEAEGG